MPDHEHDLRRNPFVIYQVSATPHEEVVCASTGCGFRLLRPILGTPLAASSWPKATP